MIEWWGQIIHEFYAGSEGNGFIACNSEEWLAHKGSVGRPLNCELHICNDEGDELPVGESGTIYFGGGGTFGFGDSSASLAALLGGAGGGFSGKSGSFGFDGNMYNLVYFI